MATHIVRIGPVTLGDGETHVYLRIAEGPDVSQPQFHPGDVEGVRALLEGVDASNLVCDPALAEAAAELGLPVAPSPPWVLSARAAIAVFMAWGQRGAAGLGSDLALQLIEAASVFWSARPWAHWSELEPFDLRFSGALSGVYEGAIFASPEQGYGLALYERRGDVRRVALLSAAGEHETARGLPAFGLMLDDKPPYAVQALADAAQVPRLPFPLKTGPQGPKPASASECVALVAALNAVARCTPQLRQGNGEAVVRGESVTVQVIAPAPVLRN